jgi:hypothetical protein
VILITFFFKKMMKKISSKPWMFYVFYFFSIKKLINLPKFTPTNIDQDVHYILKNKLWNCKGFLI